MRRSNLPHRLHHVQRGKHCALSLDNAERIVRPSPNSLSLQLTVIAESPLVLGRNATVFIG